MTRMNYSKTITNKQPLSDAELESLAHQAVDMLRSELAGDRPTFRGK